jgi:hypothetical protein
MNISRLEEILFIYLITMIYNTIIVQTSMEFMNENETDILFSLKDALILQQNSENNIYDGSGGSSKIVGITFFLI